ncbi:MAG: ACP S-malonyltransferase [Gemmatimonadota bacterium]|nr:ACP S-malonyltransferase [Gemmatimonadota bacterium]
MNVILLFPGQGSQKPGMGKELAAAFPAARAVFDQIDDLLSLPLSTLCFDGPSEELTLTLNAQPALYAHGAAAWAVVRDMLANRIVAAGGHSLGELTAHHAADSLSLDDGARLVRRRGELMYETGSTRPGTMAAVLGKLSQPIDVICELATREAGLVVPANYNTDEQVVISGEVAGVERAMQLAREAGARRALPLPVSGAFHSPLMQPVEIAFSGAVLETDFNEAEFPVYSNVTAAPCTSAADARTLLLRQLTSPVQWSAEVRAMAAAYPDPLYVELGPGNVLCGLVARIVPGARALSVGAPADVDKLAEALG